MKKGSTSIKPIKEAYSSFKPASVFTMKRVGIVDGYLVKYNIMRQTNLILEILPWYSVYRRGFRMSDAKIDSHVDNAGTIVGEEFDQDFLDLVNDSIRDRYLFLTCPFTKEVVKEFHSILSNLRDAVDGHENIMDDKYFESVATYQTEMRIGFTSARRRILIELSKLSEMITHGRNFICGKTRSCSAKLRSFTDRVTRFASSVFEVFDVAAARYDTFLPGNVKTIRKPSKKVGFAPQLDTTRAFDKEKAPVEWEQEPLEESLEEPLEDPALKEPLEPSEEPALEEALENEAFERAMPWVTIRKRR